MVGEPLSSELPTSPGRHCPDLQAPRFEAEATILDSAAQICCAASTEFIFVREREAVWVNESARRLVLHLLSAVCPLGGARSGLRRAYLRD